MTQWRDLKELLEQEGAAVHCLAPVRGLPDLVFTANAAMIDRRVAVLSRFRHPQRQGEEPYNEAWLSQHGFEIRRLPPDLYFEGAGDALFCGETLFAGYRIRSDIRGHQQIGRELGRRVIPLELVNPYYYHLDTCFCPLAAGVAVWFPPAFDEYGRRVIEVADPGADPGRGVRVAEVCLQRRGGGPHGDHQHRLPGPGARNWPIAASSRARRRWTSSSRPAVVPNA